MKKCLWLLIAGFVCLNVYAQDSSRLYSLVSGATVYLKHEVFMDPSLCRNVELFKRWEAAQKTQMLSSYFALSSGSGFLVGDDGLLLTNRHVAEVADLADLRSRAANSMAQAVEQTLSKAFTADDIRTIKLDLYSMITKGKYRFSATLGKQVLPDIARLAAAGESEPDLAAFEVPQGTGHGLALADSSTLTAKLIGKEVYSFGFPLGANMEGKFKDLVVTMNKGAISAIRDADFGIQHSAAISHGNSGGPLVDASGLVLGMNSAVMEEGNSLFLAIGADRIRAFLVKKGIVIPSQKPADLSVDQTAGSAALTAPIALTEQSEDAADIEPAAGSTAIEVAPRVYVESVAGSEVIINGKKVGITPITINLIDDSTKISIHGERGSYSALLRLNPALHGTTVLKAELRRSGELFVSSDDSSARVLIDGVDIGPAGTGDFREVPVGDRRLELVGRNTYFSQAVAIAENEPAHISASLRPVGALEIKVPSDVLTTVSSAGYNATISGTARLSHIPAGDYSLTSGGGDYFTVKTTFSLKKAGLATWDPYAFGTIAFSVSPANSLCSLGTGKTYRTDEEASGLAPGSYTAVIRHPGYKDQEMSFNVLAGRRTLVSASLCEFGRGALALPLLGGPLQIKVMDEVIEGKAGEDGWVRFEGIPSGFPVSVSFISLAAKTTSVPDQVITLGEGESRNIVLQSGRFVLPWIPGGATVEIGAEPKIELKSEGGLGFLSPALAPGTYELTISGGPKGTDCSIEATILPGDPREPAGYRSAMLGSLGFEKNAEGGVIAKRRAKISVGITGIAMGVVGVGGALAAYFLGSQAMDDYRAAPDAASAAARRNDAVFWKNLSYSSAGVGSLGLLISPFLLLGGPDPKVLQHSIDALDEGIKALAQ